MWRAWLGPLVALDKAPVQPRSLLNPADADVPRVRPAVLAKGFRPFFWLAAAYAAVAMPVWTLALRGQVNPGAYFGGIFWHAHEMIFGFALAVIAGFLLTAVGNWTSRETAVGGPLGFLAGLWVLGRVGVIFADQLPRALPAVLDLAFVPALAIACALPIARTKNRRNYQFVVLLTLLFCANLGMHLGALGVAPTFTRKGAWLAVYAVILMILVMTGRVVPMFTKNATRVESIRSHAMLDRAAIAAALVTAASDLLAVDERLVAGVSALAGVLVLARSVHWGGRHTLSSSLLWVLHLGHTFVGVGFLLRGVGLFAPVVAPSLALHALTAGGIGLLTLGMMARVALGHTGRMLAVKPIISLSFALVALAALVRVAGPMLGAKAYLHSMMTSGILFAVAFVLYLAAYTPILFSPRVDGKPG